VPFWVSTALGILGVSVIHTTIGGGLDEMTSADDFHLISWKNFLGLAAVVVGVLIPVGLRYWFRREVDAVADVGQGDGEELEGAIEYGDDGTEGPDRILAAGPRLVTNKMKNLNGRLVMLEDEEDEDYDDDEDDEDEDLILEAGPAISVNTKGNNDIHNATAGSTSW